MRVLVACEFSGVVRDAFRARGHDARTIELWDALPMSSDARSVLLDLNGLRNAIAKARP